MQPEIFIPLATYPEANGEAFIEHVVSTTKPLSARLRALAINPKIPDLSNALSTILLNTPGLVRQLETTSRERGDHLLSLLRKRAEDAGLEIASSSIATHIASTGPTAAAHARYFDMSVIGFEQGNATSRQLASDVLFGSGRPVLLLPEASVSSVFDHVAVAWDGSRAAARAVADAMVFLRAAEQVTIITIIDEGPLEEGAGSGQRLAEVLRQRGMNATATATRCGSSPIGNALQLEALRIGCQLLVMGGFGHSRLQEFLLGGATEGVLKELLLPVLISH